jgi:hypothetical protein
MNKGIVFSTKTILLSVIYFLPGIAIAQKYVVSKNERKIEILSGAASYDFTGDFTILYTESDPDMALRPAGIDGVSYNVPTWKTYPGKRSDLKNTKTDDAVAGDGFDDKILRSKQTGRTVNIVNAAKEIRISPSGISQKGPKG